MLYAASILPISISMPLSDIFLAERGEHLVGIKFSVFCFCHYDRLAFKRFITPSFQD